MNWFTRLTGIQEQSPEQVRSQLVLDGSWLTSRVNGHSGYCGTLATPMLHDLRDRLGAQLEQKIRSGSTPQLQVREVVADVTHLHADERNAGAVFQVASQFNLLEMVSPHVTPEQGVGIYDRDPTQGPACAIACGAATIWRNYFMPLAGQTGQSSALQFDALADLGRELHNKDSLWRMVNGYALASRQGLERMNALLTQADGQLHANLAGFIRTGVQADAQVTLPGCSHRVTQVLCSALPVAYSQHAPEHWERFARLVLDAAYEATLFVAMQNLLARQQNRVYLTLLGGGAFGNHTEWILDSLGKALRTFAVLGLDVSIVSYNKSNPAVRQLVDQLKDEFELQRQARYAELADTRPGDVSQAAATRRDRLQQLMQLHGQLTAVLEQDSSLLSCPACNQPYSLHGRPLDRLAVLERMTFINTRYNLQHAEGRLAIPLCHDCESQVVSRHPVIDGQNTLDMSLNGHRIFRHAESGSHMHWIHL